MPQSTALNYRALPALRYADAVFIGCIYQQSKSNNGEQKWNG